MGKQVSVVKHENTILPAFRSRISRAESTEDVKKFFVHSIRELLVNIFQDDRYQDFDAISLSPQQKPLFKLKKDETMTSDFAAMWRNSDLQRVIGRLAETASNRYRHLERKPEKTETKIRN